MQVTPTSYTQSTPTPKASSTPTSVFQVQTSTLRLERHRPYPYTLTTLLFTVCAPTGALLQIRVACRLKQNGCGGTNNFSTTSRELGFRSYSYFYNCSMLTSTQTFLQNMLMQLVLSHMLLH